MYYRQYFAMSDVLFGWNNSFTLQVGESLHRSFAGNIVLPVEPEMQYIITIVQYNNTTDIYRLSVELLLVKIIAIIFHSYLVLFCTCFEILIFVLFVILIDLYIASCICCKLIFLTQLWLFIIYVITILWINKTV